MTADPSAVKYVVLAYTAAWPDPKVDNLLKNADVKLYVIAMFDATGIAKMLEGIHRTDL
ncbi:hypothetical protein V7S43_013225 [Phytophthora oleae]|uniref:Uncharacterized protein n=1 Tax=Phytophthora oleae TaxID=2107226 RepID=A0ABD3F5E6_9STRA